MYRILQQRQLQLEEVLMPALYNHWCHPVRYLGYVICV